MKALVDTCVLIDVLQAREPFLADSKKVLLASANEVIEGLITAKAVTDVFYIMHRYFHDNEKCHEVIRSLYTVFTVVDTTASACLQASFSAVGDYEDAVMDETARANGADVIVTRNVRDYRMSSVKALAPTDVVALLGLDGQGLPAEG